MATTIRCLSRKCFAAIDDGIDLKCILHNSVLLPPPLLLLLQLLLFSSLSFFSVDTIACIRSTACVCVCVWALCLSFLLHGQISIEQIAAIIWRWYVMYVCTVHCTALCTSPSRYIPIRCIWLVIYCVDLCGVMEIQCNVFLFYSAIHSFHVRFGGRKTERQNKEIAVEFWHRWKCPQVERSYSL